MIYKATIIVANICGVSSLWTYYRCYRWSISSYSSNRCGIWRRWTCWKYYGCELSSFTHADFITSGFVSDFSLIFEILKHK